MNDLYHFWAGDISAGTTGDLATTSGTTMGQQRVLRRLLTNPGDYIFQPDYGAGLPQFVGQALDAGKVAAVIRAQLLMEQAVAQTPPPKITVKQLPTDLTALSVTISYTDSQTNQQQVLSFNVEA